MFHRPLEVVIGKPNLLQTIWAIISVILMVGVAVIGFLPDTWVAPWIAGLFNWSVPDASLILKGISIGAIIMALFFAFLSNQISVPWSQLENHWSTAMLVGIVIAFIGIALNWPAFVDMVQALWNKLDLLWLCLVPVGILIALAAGIIWRRRVS